MVDMRETSSGSRNDGMNVSSQSSERFSSVWIADEARQYSDNTHDAVTDRWNLQSRGPNFKCVRVFVQAETTE